MIFLKTKKTFNKNEAYSDREDDRIAYEDFHLLDKPVIDVLKYLEKLQLKISAFQYDVLNSLS